MNCRHLRSGPTLGMLLLAWWHIPSHSQSSSKQTETRCNACTIELSQIIVLRADTAPLGHPTSIAQDRHGFFYVTGEGRREAVTVFSQTGSLLRTIGRAGEGPLEFRWAGHLAMQAGDTLHIIDVALHRRTLLSPDGKVLRTTSLPLGGFGWESAFSRDGHWVVNMFIPSTDHAGQPLHLVEYDGRIGRSFGADPNDIVRRDLRATYFRKLAQSRAGGIWSGRINEYRFELWRLDGKKVKEFKRTPAWFKPWVTDITQTTKDPPNTSLVALREDSLGVLWAFFNVPSSRWKETLVEWRTGEGLFYRPKDDNVAYETIVEAMDPEGNVLASGKFPVRIIGITSSGFAYNLRESDNGHIRLGIWKFRLVQPTIRRGS